MTLDAPSTPEPRLRVPLPSGTGATSMAGANTGRAERSTMTISASLGTRPGLTIISTGTPGQALEQTRTLLPAIEVKNQQLLEEAPTLMKSLGPIASSLRAGGFGIFIDAAADGSSTIDICTPDAAGEPMRNTVCDALSSY